MKEILIDINFSSFFFIPFLSVLLNDDILRGSLAWTSEPHYWEWSSNTVKSLPRFQAPPLRKRGSLTQERYALFILSYSGFFQVK